MDYNEATTLMLAARKKALEGKLPCAEHLQWRAMLRPDVFEAIRCLVAETVLGHPWRSHDDEFLHDVSEAALADDRIKLFGFQIGRDDNATEAIFVFPEQRRGKMLRVQQWYCNGCRCTVETRTGGQMLVDAVCPNCKSVLQPHGVAKQPHLVVEF